MQPYDYGRSSPKDAPSADRVLKYHLTSLGCPKNLVESEEMMARLALSGMVLVHDPEEADLLVVNTCGFIGPAKEESIDVILDLCRIRQKTPATVGGSRLPVQLPVAGRTAGSGRLRGRGTKPFSGGLGSGGANRDMPVSPSLRAPVC